MIIPPKLRDQLDRLAADDGPTVREMYKEARERDLEEQQRQEQARQENQERQQLSHDYTPDYTPWRWQHNRSRRRDYDPAPRELTMRDVADYEKASELYELRDMAREASRQDRLIQKIEGLMNRDFDAYANSIWPETYARLTGADRDAAERNR